jgi:hypothetical protein
MTKQAPAKPYRTAKTREGTTALTGHYPMPDAYAFRSLAALQGKDVQELLGEAINLVFEKYGIPNRIESISGRRKRYSRVFSVVEGRVFDVDDEGRIIDGPEKTRGA